MIVKTEKLSRRYGPVSALNLVSLEIPDHEIYCLVGPSGSGKTTLVRILNGLETPSSGSAQVLGEPLPRGHGRVAGRIGYMPQEVALYRDLTVQENPAPDLRVAAVHRTADLYQLGLERDHD